MWKKDRRIRRRKRTLNLIVVCIEMLNIMYYKQQASKDSYIAYFETINYFCFYPAYSEPRFFFIFLYIYQYIYNRYILDTLFNDAVSLWIILHTSMTVYLVILDMCIDFNLRNVYYYLKYYINATVSDIYSIDAEHFLFK